MKRVADGVPATRSTDPLRSRLLVHTFLLLILMPAQAALSQVSGRGGSLPPIRAEHHAHIRSPAAAELFVMRSAKESGEATETEQATTAGDLIEALDRAGIQSALVISSAYRIAQPDYDMVDEIERVRSENDYIAEQVALASERLVPVCSVNPLRDYAGEEIRRCATELGVNVFKFHFANSDVNLRDDSQVGRIAKVFRIVDDLGGTALAHIRTRNDDYGAIDAERFIKGVLAPLPGLYVQIAHMAGWGGYDEGTDAALVAFIEAIADGVIDRERVQFDLAAVVFAPDAAGDDAALADSVAKANQLLADRIRQLGADRVLFATDWPSWPPTSEQDAKIEQNVWLLHKELPLTEAEWDVIDANASPAITRMQ